MARTTFGGYGLTELRQIAREAGIKGRSKMTGEQLHTAYLAYVDATRKAQEQAVIGSITVGALLRHKTSGDIIRVTGEVYTWQPVGATWGAALCVPAEYVEAKTHWTYGETPRADYAKYLNEGNERTGHVARHPIFQYEAV